MLKIGLLLFIIPVLFTSCQMCSDSGPDSEFEIPDSVMYAETLEVSEEVMEGIISNVSSVIETSSFIRDLDVPYSNSYLATTANLDNYNTNFRRALMLGIYAADLGYLNMYNRTTEVLDYLTSIRRLSGGLNVDQFFNFSTLRRLANSQDNLDSLMFISMQSFNRMDNYLREEQRAHLSAAMVAGVWLEGLYLLTQVAQKSSSDELFDRIAEQKIILDELVIIFKNYGNVHPEFDELYEELAEIKQIFDEVSITYEHGEPEAVEKDGKLMIIQKERSIVNITEEQVNDLTETTEKIRNKLIL